MYLYQICSGYLLCDDILNSENAAHLHNICMDFPQFHSDEDVYGKRYSEKTSYSKRHNYFLQLRVPYTLFYRTPIYKYAEIRRNRDIFLNNLN